jgi:hypothetical protein
LHAIFDSLKRKTEMKASVLKVAVFVLLLTIFCIVALTARWAEKSGYDHISHRSEQTDGPVPDSAARWNRVDSLSAGSDVRQTEPETQNPFLAAWIARSGNNHDQAELQVRSGDRKLNPFGKNLAQGDHSEDSEGPDDRKYTYGDTDVE